MSDPYQGLGPTLAECLTAEKIALTAELAQVKAERDEWKRRFTDREELRETMEVRREVGEDAARLLATLAETQAELKASRTLDGLAFRAMRKQRDQALSHLSAVLDTSEPTSPASIHAGVHDDARAFLLHERESDE